MRLTKTVYFFEEDGEVLVGYDWLNEPIYEKTYKKTSIECEIEPYSSKLAENTYGIIADVQYRLFMKPDERLKMGETIEYQNENYTITGIMKYDKHFEVLMKKGG